MNRAELVTTMSNETGFTKSDCDRWLVSFMSTVTKNMKKSEGVKIVGFGTFTTAKRKARTGRNPHTGKALKIPAKTVPVFRAGASLKETVRKVK